MAIRSDRSIEELRIEMMSTGEELLAAIHEEQRFNKKKAGGPVPRVEDFRAARSLVDTLSHKYNSSIRQYREALEAAILPGIERR